MSYLLLFKIPAASLQFLFATVVILKRGDVGDDYNDGWTGAILFKIKLNHVPWLADGFDR